MSTDIHELMQRLQGTWRPPATDSSQVTVSLLFDHSMRMTVHALSNGEKWLQQLKGDQVIGTWDVHQRMRPRSKSSVASSSARIADSFTPKMRPLKDGAAQGVKEGPFLVLRISDLPKASTNINIMGIRLDVANWAVSLGELAAGLYFRIVDAENHETSLDMEGTSGVIQTWMRVKRAA
ncbi:hypothetical protein BX281_0122 [Streptomyces sp. Ag82_O1-15]|uniref:hypothetical protein n=1 Tax=Streptomyces sp. Ag82_O1-15 TaxID=1938855 RepID=UPI000BC6216E|nr:hypothetical protein [Streptomyces sp. Ag82_O1-15]PBC92467.1 hypothetical protein BX281_0122 [Streptomyces sp. Ag82_O1-15]